VLRRILGVLVVAGLIAGLALLAGPSPKPTPAAKTAPAPSRVALPPGTTAVTALRAEAGGGHFAGTTVDLDNLVSQGTPLTLTYPGASYVKVHFNRLLLLPGEYVTVSDRTGGQLATYRFAVSSRWAMSVDGDTAVVTMHGRLAHVLVDKVARGFTAAEQDRQAQADQARWQAAVAAMGSGRCPTGLTAGAACYEGTDPTAYRGSRAVARLLIGGTELCTAWRVGPNNRMLTSHHCFASTADARDVEVWFGYACPVCGGTAAASPVKVNGDAIVATDPRLDYTLFTVQNFDSVSGFGYLTLDNRQPGPGERVYIPQYPGGQPLSIAEDVGGACAVDTPVVDGYAAGTDVSYRCDAAAGSSGAPVLSRLTDRVVALHHFGGCPDAGVRGDLILQKIAGLL
jgi:lysyl endopeptidase